ncbi:MAG TPA: Gfo/Idh/MocA family oxidoreductase [Caldilineaceae bacterium]|nr:Gfo/Idh/MocA family oxidoreductase [Caldilineaceae bacterium]
MSQTRPLIESAPFEQTTGPLRAIVVGAGGISATMLKLLGQQPWYRTAAVVDIRPQALEAAKEQYDLDDSALFTDLDRALAEAEADVVLINTPSELHYAQSKAALEAGRHVLVAKPITNSFEEAVALVELAEANRRALCVGQQMRYNRHYTTVRDYLATGALGHAEMVHFLNAKPRHKALNLATMSQPALYEMSCHHFDSLMSLFPGQAPEWIMVDGFRPSWSVYAGPCTINGLLRFSDGLHVLYHGGFSSQADLYELRIEGSEGALRCRGIHMSNDAMAYETAPRNGQWTHRALDEGRPALSPWLPFFEHWRHYLAHGSLADGSEPPFSGRNNLKVFALLSAGIDSIESGRPVEVAANPRYRVAFEN